MRRQVKYHTSELTSGSENKDKRPSLKEYYLNKNIIIIVFPLVFLNQIGVHSFPWFSMNSGPKLASEFNVKNIN